MLKFHEKIVNSDRKFFAAKAEGRINRESLALHLSSGRVRPRKNITGGGGGPFDNRAGRRNDGRTPRRLPARNGKTYSDRTGKAQTAERYKSGFEVLPGTRLMLPTCNRHLRTLKCRRPWMGSRRLLRNRGTKSTINNSESDSHRSTAKFLPPRKSERGQGFSG